MNLNYYLYAIALSSYFNSVYEIMFFLYSHHWFLFTNFNYYFFVSLINYSTFFFFLSLKVFI